jgi:thiamine-phosphate pyrophosphorylase
VSATGDARRRRLAGARLYLVAGPETGGPRWRQATQRALGSGAVDALQLRLKQASDAEVLVEASWLRAACDAVGALLIVNDLASLAAPAAADGAHVGEHDLSPGLARLLLGPERLLGLSTHDAVEVRAAHAAGADYVGLGPCFPTASKALTRVPGGPALVGAALAAAGDVPLFPIGGITEATLPALVQAGATRAAVGRAVLEADDPAQAARRLAALLPPAR